MPPCPALLLSRSHLIDLTLGPFGCLGYFRPFLTGYMYLYSFAACSSNAPLSKRHRVQLTPTNHGALLRAASLANSKTDIIICPHLRCPWLSVETRGSSAHCLKSSQSAQVTFPESAQPQHRRTSSALGLSYADDADVRCARLCVMVPKGDLKDSGVAAKQTEQSASLLSTDDCIWHHMACDGVIFHRLRTRTRSAAPPEKCLRVCAPQP